MGMSTPQGSAAQASTAVSVANRPERIRVLIADTTPMGCELLKTALTRDRRLEIAGLATTVKQIVTGTAPPPDVAIVSHQLKDGPAAGMKALRHLCVSPQLTRVIMLFDDGDQDDVVESFRAGAKAVFRRSGALQDLVRCVYAVHNGQIWASSADLNLVLRAFASTAPLRCISARGENMLTPREQQVLELVAEGLTNAEISGKLQIREHTVKNYLFKIYDKLGISTRVELILYAVSRRPAA